MDEVLLSHGALAWSYFWQLVLLPKHGYRLARIRLECQRCLHELSQKLAQEIEAQRKAAAAARELEDQLAAADLTLAASRRLVIQATEAALARLRHHVAASFPEVAEIRSDRDERR